MFVGIGIALFIADGLWTDDASDNLIVVTGPDINRLAGQWEAQMGREPTTDELDGLIDNHVREEMFVREALKLGLDRNDVIIRRRLAQKLQFVTEDRSLLEPANEADLRAYYQEHQHRYEQPLRLTFSHIFFSPDRRDDPAKEASAVLPTLTDDNWRDAGDPFILRRTYANVSPAEIRRDFGSRFATGVQQLAQGNWQGPVVSGYGQHLVKLSGRTEARTTTFEDAELRVRNDFDIDRRDAANEAYLQDMRTQYRIEIER